MKNCSCNLDNACSAHAESLYGWEPDPIHNSWNEAKDIAINAEIAKLAKVDSREVYNDNLSDEDMQFLDMVEIQKLFTF